VIAVDTSVVVAGLCSWHDRHDVCRPILDEKPVIVGHVLVESFSVLTRLPAPYRVSAELAAELLAANFPREPLTMKPEEVMSFVAGLPQWRVIGGAVYDALIAATARDAGAALLTLDARAARTYLAIGVDTQLV